MVQCIECEASFERDLSRIEVGGLLICPECGAEMEVLKVQPLKLGRATVEEDDGGE